MSAAFNLDLEGLALIAVRTITMYVALLLLLRLAGKRALGQSATFDLVVLLLIANAVQNGMVGSDSSVVGGLVSAVSVLAANAIVDRLGIRFPSFRRRLLGTPTLLVQDGHLLEANCRREGVLEEEIMEAVREHGGAHLADVNAAFLELDGTISIIPLAVSTSHMRRRVSERMPSP